MKLVPSWSCSLGISKPVWHIPLLCVQWKTPDDGQRNCSKHVDKNGTSSILILLASCQQTCMTYTIGVCTVKNSWWWTEELSETCRSGWNSFHPDLHVSWSTCCFVVGPAGPTTKQHNCHHDTKVKPKAATVVIELLMIGGKTLKTYWAVNKRHDNKLKNYCVRMVIYLNCTKIHGLTNLKFYI